MSLRTTVETHEERINRLFKYDSQQDDRIFKLEQENALLHSKHNTLMDQFNDLKEKFDAIVKQQRIKFVEVEAVPAHLVARVDRG